jgi:hypothetical protein
MAGNIPTRAHAWQLHALPKSVSPTRLVRSQLGMTVRNQRRERMQVDADHVRSCRVPTIGCDVALLCRPTTRQVRSPSGTARPELTTGWCGARWPWLPRQPPPRRGQLPRAWQMRRTRPARRNRPGERLGEPASSSSTPSESDTTCGPDRARSDGLDRRWRATRTGQRAARRARASISAPSAIEPSAVRIHATVRESCARRVRSNAQVAARERSRGTSSADYGERSFPRRAVRLHRGQLP